MKYETYCRVWTSNQDYKDLTKEEWFDFNKVHLHRTDGPVVEFWDGSEEWWLNGQRHRTDSPSYIGSDGRKEWRQHGKLHRLDGPALMYPGGCSMWWINDCPLDQTQVENWIQENNINLSTLEGQSAFKLKFS